MNHHPPHLPKKSCSITLHNLWHNIRNITFFVLLSVFAGITGALIATAWIEPTFYNTAGAFLVNRPTDSQYISQEYPDPQIAQRVQYGTLKMYERSQEVSNTSFFPDAAFLGRAVMISSDGWAVAHLPALNNIADRVTAVDYQGMTYDISRVVADPLTDFVYIKFDGADFRVMSFVDWEHISSGADVWSVHQDGIYRRYIGRAFVPDTDVYSAFVPYHHYDVVPARNEAGMIIDSQGQFVGFVDEYGQLHSAWSVTHHMTSLLSKNILANPTFSLQGYIVKHSGVEQHEQTPLYGFVVTRAAGTSGLFVGDVITQIDGDDIVPETWYQDVYALDSETSVHVLRGTREIDIIPLQ